MVDPSSPGTGASSPPSSLSGRAFGSTAFSRVSATGTGAAHDMFIGSHVPAVGALGPYRDARISKRPFDDRALTMCERQRLLFVPALTTWDAAPTAAVSSTQNFMQIDVRKEITNNPELLAIAVAFVAPPGLNRAETFTVGPMRRTRGKSL